MGFKKGILVMISLFFFYIIDAQDFSDLWKEYYSYLNIRDFSSGPDRLYAASENAVFSIDYNTNQLEEITTINGLSGESISTIYYSEGFDLLLIGYETGLIDIFRVSENEVLTVIDILNKPTIPPDQKKINHFFEINGRIMISTDFGISEYDLNRLEFGDTYFIGSGGSQIRVSQTNVLNGAIYAACLDGNGLKRAGLDDPNLINSNVWSTISGGSYVSIQSIDNSLVVLNDNRSLFRIINDNLSLLTTFSSQPIDLRSMQSKLVTTFNNSVEVFDFNLNTVATSNVTENFDTSFTVASINDFDEIFIGTRGDTSDGRTGFGVLLSNFGSPSEFVSIHPDGPLLNSVFEISTPSNEIWSVFGGYSRSLNPFVSGVRFGGYSHFTEETWNNTTYNELKKFYNEPLSLSHISVNPFDNQEVFISSYWSGLLELNEEIPVELYNASNSTIVPFTQSVYFLSVSKFDGNGALWVANGRVERPLNRFENGQWTSFDFTSVIDPPTSNLGFFDMAINRDGAIFLGTFDYGLLAFKNNGGTPELVFADSEEDNMPSRIVRSLALDNNGQLWIGTAFGLRVLFNPSNFFEDQEVSNIVILEDGIPRELLQNQVITDIEVDGSNNKWVGTGDSGVFYLSSDGQETIYHFTKDNSPLPSNVINDISIDRSNGAVYFATPKGLLSFGSGGSSPTEDLESAYVYPNPVRPEYDILGFDDLNNITNGVKIKGITENVNIKITDIEGNLVAEAQSNINRRTSRANYNFAIDGGTAIWNGKNLANNIVASGVYLILISDLDSLETKVLKLLIVR